MKIIPTDKLSKKWVRSLNPGNKVWLFKEQRSATIAYRWTHPRDNEILGFIGLEVSPGHFQLWNMNEDGCGFDGGRLLLPIEGHFDFDPKYDWTEEEWFGYSFGEHMWGCRCEICV